MNSNRKPMTAAENRLPRFPYNRNRRPLQLAGAALLAVAACGQARAAESAVPVNAIRFVVVDAKTHLPINGAQVSVQDLSGRHFTCVLPAGLTSGSATAPFEPASWSICSAGSSATVFVPLDGEVTIQAKPTAQAGPPVRDIYVKVTAKRVVKRSDTGGGTTLTGTDLKNRLGSSSGPSSSPIKASTTTGATEDSAGQVHVRGEHSEIAYVIDGVALPDSLSGRQGSLIVPATIQSLDIITGGFAPEFGGQTAAVLNVSTLPDVAHAHSEYEIAGGSNSTFTSNITALGPINSRASYVINIAASRTNMAQEPQQPDKQTAHNQGASIDMFAKLHFNPNANNSLTLTISRSPDTQQVNNRTGITDSKYAAGGQGFGFLGLRNADGTRPDAIGSSAAGAGTMLLSSQQEDGMDITTREVNEFAALLWKHQITKRDTGIFSVTLMHSGQDVHNNNPAVNLLGLPVDNSIEYNPTATRNIHHVQTAGSLSFNRGAHNYKAGILVDDQNGTETYQIVPASQLALNALAALAPNLAPAGAVLVDGSGNVVTDVDGNPVYVASSSTSPIVTIHRSGFYRAAYAQDSWDINKKTRLNYGMRFDWFKQTQSLGATVDTSALEPRLNLTYTLNPLTVFRLSYNRLFNTPPIAQGASIGSSIQPETLDQYDLSADRDISKGQHIKLAYYIKQMRNQVDTGLLIPGSMIGLYSAVNFQVGAVHGLEFAYTLSPLIIDPKTKKKYGWESYLNYSYSIAAPNGLDNSGAPVPNFNDHDQRNTLSLGATYNWLSGYTAGVMINHASGLASSPVPPSVNRIPHTVVDLQASTGNRLFHGKGGVGFEINNLFDVRDVINFQSGFSGTRFMEGRRFMLNVFGQF